MTTPEIAAIYRQLREITMLDHRGRCAAILVTPFGLRGSITAMVASPERQRLLRGSVDPDLTVRDLYELYVHPDDWGPAVAGAVLGGVVADAECERGVPVGTSYSPRRASWSSSVRRRRPSRSCSASPS